MRQLIVQRFNLRFSTVHVWRLLGQLGFSPQRTVGPRPRARRSEDCRLENQAMAAP
ncbi:MAG: winged helix-turn-helix domain-containing protein [Lacunisphaera sp.]